MPFGAASEMLKDQHYGIPVLPLSSSSRSITCYLDSNIDQKDLTHEVMQETVTAPSRAKR